MDVYMEGNVTPDIKSPLPCGVRLAGFLHGPSFYAELQCCHLLSCLCSSRRSLLQLQRSLLFVGLQAADITISCD
jgi:hypothetical protein